MDGWRVDGWMDGRFVRRVIRSFLSNWTCTSFKKFHYYLIHKSFSPILKAFSFHGRFTQLIGQLLRLTWELYNPVLTASGQTHSRLNALQASPHLLAPAPPLPQRAPPSPGADTLRAFGHLKPWSMSGLWPFKGQSGGLGGGGSGPAETSNTQIIKERGPRRWVTLPPGFLLAQISIQSTRTKKAQENGEGEGHRLLTSKGDKHCSKKKRETELQEDSREESER